VVGVEIKPEPPAEQDKIDQILKQMKNQDRESKLIQKLFETHNRETGDVKYKTEVLEGNLEDLSETISVIWDFRQLVQIVKTWEEKQQVMLSKIYRMEEESVKNNIVIFGLKEKRN
jgi:hypothetical protein